MRSRLTPFFAALTLVLVAGCTTFDPLDQTGKTINRNATDYANDAMLLNVIRATNSEPLTFITITSLNGTQSATGSVGLPSIALGSGATGINAIGPNAVSRTNTNTFQMNVVDDPASFAALLAPISPATTALFIQQGYPRELLFFLFTSRIREVAMDKGKVLRTLHEWSNYPYDDKVKGEFDAFQAIMADLLLYGLTAQTDVTTVPTGRTMPPSRLCIDRTIEPPYFATQAGSNVPKVLPGRPGPETCENADWIQTVAGGTTSASSGSGGGETNTMTVGPDNSLWVAVAGQNSIVRITAGPGGALTSSGPIRLPAVERKPKQAPLIAYPLEVEVIGEDGKLQTRHFQLFMRSTYGVYDYIGALLRLNTDINNLHSPDPSGYPGMVDVVPPRAVTSTNTTAGCFAEADHRGTHYCVPNRANRTKRLFALLHQLQQLSTAPSNTPTTLTVTTVP